MMEGSASVNVIQPLIDLQDTDGQIRELEREARDIPQRKAQEIARLNGVNAALEIAKNQLAAMQQRIKSEEAEAEEIRAKVREVKTSQLSIKTVWLPEWVSVRLRSRQHRSSIRPKRPPVP